MQSLQPHIVDSTIRIYQAIKAALLPVPGKAHYQFSLREISKVFQGLYQTNSKYVSSVQDYLKAWYHESLRVFHDRLINQ